MRYEIRALSFAEILDTAFRLVREIEESERRFFVVIDDNLASDPRTLREFCERITPMKINWVSQTSITLARNEDLLDAVAESGCRGFLVGFESTNPTNLLQMNKTFNNCISYTEALERFNERGIRIHGSFLIGYDDDTDRSIDELVDFAIASKLFIANFNPLTPVPKTRLYERLQREGRLTNETWWLDYEFRYGDFVFTPKHMSACEMALKCEEGKARFYGVGSIVSRGLVSSSNVRSLKGLGVYMLCNYLTRREVRSKSQAYLGLEAPVSAIEPEVAEAL